LIETAARLQKSSFVTTVFPPDISGWRNLAYYLPESSLVVVGDETGGSVPIFRIHGGHDEVAAATTQGVSIPSCGLIALADTGRPDWDRSRPPEHLSRDHNFWLFPASPGVAFRAQGVRFKADGPCPGDQ
jgi:hypothetical protein